MSIYFGNAGKEAGAGNTLHMNILNLQTLNLISTAFPIVSCIKFLHKIFAMLFSQLKEHL